MTSFIGFLGQSWTLKFQKVQVNICQKLLFLHQLTHNMMTDCSLLMKTVSSEYLQNMLCAQIVVFVLFWHSEQFWYTKCSADVASFWKRFTCKNEQFFCVNQRLSKLCFQNEWTLFQIQSKYNFLPPKLKHLDNKRWQGYKCTTIY